MKRNLIPAFLAASVGLTGLGAAPDAGDALRLGVPGAANSGVSLAASGSEVVVAWAAVAGGATDVHVARSSDGGVTFGAPLRVNDVAGDARVSPEQAPRVALGNGVAVAWLSRQGSASVVRAATMTAGERAFAPARTVHAENLTGARGWQSVAVDPAGGVHVAWLDGRNAGGSMRQDLFQMVRRADGSSEEAHVAKDVCFCCKTSLASGGDGATYVAWRHIYPTDLRDIAVARSTDGGKTFGAPVRVSEDGWQIAGCPDDGPSIAVDTAGIVHVAWPTMVPGAPSRKGIFYSSSTDGGQRFSPRLRVDEGDVAAGHPHLAVSQNRVAVVWDEAGERRRILLREIVAEAGKSRLGSVVALSNAERPIYPAIAATPTSWLVAWTEPAATGSEIRLRRVPTGEPR